SLASGDLAKLLQGVTDLVDVSAGADIGVALASTIQLGVGIDLTDPSNPTTFLTEGSGVKIEGRLFGQGLNVRASLGPLGLSIAEGSAAIDADGDAATDDHASLSFNLKPDTADHRYTFSELSGNLNGLMQAPIVAGQAGLKLPLALAGTSLGNLQLKIPDLKKLFNGDSGSVQIVETPDFNKLLSELTALNLLRNPAVAVDGLNALLGVLQSGLDGVSTHLKLPIIGPAFGGAAHFIGD